MASQDEMDALVAAVVRFVIFHNHQQPGVPIKRSELVSIVTQSYKQHNLPNTIISRAQKQLNSVFGMDLRQLNKVQQQEEVQQQQQQKKNQKQASAASDYVLVSNLPANLRQEFVNEPESSASQGLAAILVAIVQLGRERCTEENLRGYLLKLGIEDNGTHPVFGNAKQAIEGVLKQKFLKKEKAVDEEGFVYVLGERACDEPVKTQLDNYISKLVQGETPEGEESMGRYP